MVTVTPRHPMMKCGHAAQSFKNGDPTKPVCVICFDKPESEQVDTSFVIPEGRMARCVYYGQREGRNGEGPCHDNPDRVCRCEELASLDLAFFERKPGKEFDEFYCGCTGWD